jgi:hypothetical protein
MPFEGRFSTIFSPKMTVFGAFFMPFRVVLHQKSVLKKNVRQLTENRIAKTLYS